MKANMKKFGLDQETEILEFYEGNGYVVIEKLLPEELIDRLLQVYYRTLAHPLFLYYSQSVHRPIRPSFTAQGHLKESMENATRLLFFPKFTAAMRNCLLADGISRVLSIISGRPKHVMRQNMLFDFSTGTIEHQDHWYLDTDPPGEMVGVWYALEDIHPESGCFFVLPGSHLGGVLSREEVPEHDHFRSATLGLIEKREYQYLDMPLHKGDILLWHPFTIHGARDNSDPQYSRKSLTAHFYPRGTRMASYSGEQSSLKSTENPHLYTAHMGTDLGLCLRYYATFLWDLLRGRDHAIQDMRRASYRKDSA